MLKTQENIVNKLLIIGNGFDLAQGLKTKYEDFLFWYLKNLLEQSFNSNASIYDQNVPSSKFHFYEDELLIIFSKNNYGKEGLNDLLTKLNSLTDILDFFNVRKQFIIEPKSKLFNVIYGRCVKGWVDIESIYYELLTSHIERNREGILELNQDFNFLKIKLKTYLRTINKDGIQIVNGANKFYQQFLEPIEKKELIDEIENIETQYLYFLNFNYTNSLKTISNFININKKSINASTNHIHGKLDDIENPMIFGFGDEMDKDYKRIEELNDNRFFENIKSFMYLNNSNYRALMRFLDSSNYQVCIYGHSCGLSDRIMLNEIFEHENCKSIKIYFYEDEEGGNDFTNKTMEISRHFNSNKLMRKKIVEFNPNNKIPQVKNKIN